MSVSRAVQAAAVAEGYGNDDGHEVVPHKDQSAIVADLKHKLRMMKQKNPRLGLKYESCKKRSKVLATLLVLLQCLCC